MDVACEKCRAKIKIPESKIEKVPKGQSFAINCPKCKNKISVTVPGAPDASAKKVPDKTAPPKPQPDKKPADDLDEEVALGGPFGFIEEGEKTAVICDPDPAIRAKIRAVLEEFDYPHISEPNSPREALKQMRSHAFDLIVLNEGFGTQDPDMNHVLKYISQLLMPVRRNMFVLLLTTRFRSLDNMIAFNKSVNAVINIEDIDNLFKFLRKALNEDEQFYRVFKDSWTRLKGI